MRSILFLLMIVAAAGILAIRLLPWWAILAAFAGVVLAVPVLLRWGLPRLLKAPFRAKGAVLRGAGVRVHSVERAEAPAAAAPGEDEALADDAGPREHYRIEVTITPRPDGGPFALWEPGELRLAGPGARADEPDADDAGEVYALEIEQDGQFLPDEGMKYGGPQRLRFVAAVPPGQRRLRFRYYFELLGDVPLPTTTVTAGRPLVTTR
jgi:hypothetical protein